MTDIERDPLVRRAIDDLRRIPATDRTAVARIVAAAAAARVAPADDELATSAVRSHRTRWWTIGGVAAAAAVVGFALSTVSNAHRHAKASVASASTEPGQNTATLQLQPVASNSADALPIVEQFVFHSRTAHRVSVVGDFNRWNPDATRMSRASDGDLWSVTVPIVPGRHMYAFMIDDSTFVLDPHQATERDADLGVQASVIVVGRP
jgi:hypothetical protein